ncbi:MAG: CHASE2 domain-containing protein [Bdellovibrionales bacterium]|nr:CHASE2 domain-containing protein [Bdellovibrionales bacterium]
MGFDNLLERLGVDPWMAKSRLKLAWRRWGWRVARGFACALAGCGCAVIAMSPIGERTEGQLRRAWYSIRGERALVAPVTVVRIDDAAFLHANKASGEPFPRDVIAKGLRRIGDAGARMVMLDMIFRRETTPEIDSKLREALAATPSVIGRAIMAQGERDADGGKRVNRMRLEPQRLFAENAGAVMSLKVTTTNGMVESISLGAEGTLTGRAEVPLLEPLREFVNPDLGAPGWRDLINYYGGPFTVPSVGFVEVLEGDTETLARHFKDRLVFIGAMTNLSTGLASLNDTFVVPVSASRMFGVEIHTTIAANLLEKSWLKRLSPEVEAIILVALGFGVTLLLLSLRLSVAAPFVIAVAVAWLGCSYVGFSALDYFIPAGTFAVIVVPGVIALRLSVPAVLTRRSDRAF